MTTTDTATVPVTPAPRSGPDDTAALAATGALLDAGAVLPAAAVTADHDTVDVLTTRAYRHPALEGRPVVRLVPATLGSAEDLTMEFLGFAAPEEVTEVGVVRQQALGFPAWALVHDPANGHHALALVKEIERLARVARSRIGPAKEGFDTLAEQLARSVPHFLPTYYEEAARAFLAAESSTYAATMFGKARDAERAYGLAIDEERQHTVFLEFALAGALTAKALSAHARDLAARSEPGTAYERFRRLCLERTLGGLPPYAAMHADLKRLAKAAKVGDEAEEEMLAELFTAPAVTRAPSAFWAAYRPALGRLARRDPAVRGRLLSMFPNDCADDVWLAVLEESGATEALTGPADAVPAGAASPDGPAGWLGRFDNHREGWRRKRLPALLDLATRMAGRLKADGEPVKLCRANDYVDFDLVDVCLAHGVPVAEPAKTARYAVQQWLADETEGRRDLAAMAADPKLRTGLAAGIEGWLEPGWRGKASAQPKRIREIIAVPGLRAAVHWWLASVADRVTGRGLPNLGSQLDRVTLMASPEGLAVNPEAVRRVVEHRLAPVLGRTLRAGVLDEYGWPALESAAATLTAGAKADPDDEDQFQLVAQWPHLIVRVRDQVLVVGDEGVVLEHLLRIPADQRHWMWRTVLRYVDGQLLVCWDIGRERAGYWSGSPDDVFVVPDDAFSTGALASVALPGGGRTAGGRPLHVGDRSEQERGRVASDGTSHWVWTRKNDKARWYEFDTVTGDLGRESLPAFFEAGAAEGEPLELGECRLLPAPDTASASPLGHRDGLVGWRLRETADHGQAGESVDGRSFRLPGDLRGSGLGGTLVGAVRFPGSGATYGLLWSTAYRDNKLVLCTEDGFVVAKFGYDGGKNKFAAGTRLLPPPAHWHYLRARDEAGSAALRAVTDGQARELLDGAAGSDRAAVVALVARVLPGITSPELVAGVAGIVRQAAKHQARLAKFGAVLAGEPLDEPAPAVEAEAEQESTEDAGRPTDKVLAAALHGFMPYCYDRGRSAVRMLEACGAALHATTGGNVEIGRALYRADHDWLQALAALPVAMYRAVSPAIPADQREGLLGLLDACAGVLSAGGRLRLVWLMPDDKALSAPYKIGDIIQFGASERFVVFGLDESDGEITALHHTKEAGFTALTGYRVRSEIPLDAPGGPTASRVADFVAAAREHGPVPWSADRVRDLSVAAGVSLAEATTLLAGLPDGGTVTRGDPAEWWRTVPYDAVEVALRTWANLPRRAGATALAALVPEDTSALWTSGPLVQRFATWWTESNGARTPVADELIVEAHRAGIASGVSASELLHGLASPGTCRWLAGRVGTIDDGELLVTLVRALPWLVYRLPTGHPVRSALPVALDRARHLVTDPELVIDIGYLDDSKIRALTSALGVEVKSDEHGIRAGALFFPPDDGWRQVQLRPALLTGPDDPLLAVLRTRLDDLEEGPLAAVRTLLSDQLGDWVTYRVPDGVAGAEHDPSRSAPALVAEVAATHGIGPDAATVYLQLLALPDPTDRNVAGWTGWKPARLKAARAELAATALVVDAKRPRAGRTLFLPGGWLALRAPHLPLERWKLPLLLGNEGAVDGLGMVIPVAPAPRLFELAWARVRDGDVPRFDNLVTERRR